MTAGQLAVLRAIGRVATDGVPLSRLAEDLVMDSTTLYRTLTPLQRAGWVEVTRAAKGRTKRARLTRTGEETAALAAPHWEGAQSDFVRAFGVERWAALHSEITALAAAGVLLNNEKTQ